MSTSRKDSRIITVVVLAYLMGSVVWMAGLKAGSTFDQLELIVRSGDPALVTGGDVLIEVVSDVGAKPVITLNDRDVSDSFMPALEGRGYLGLLAGLRVGINRIEAVQGDASAALAVTNHPVTGPVFTGPKEQPFYCETDQFLLADGSYLPKPLADDCSVATVVTYIYKPVGQQRFMPLPGTAVLPADTARTTTTTGASVPYVVRVETGTINRGIYEIAVLHDPTGQPEASPLLAASGWNQRMVYTFGGGCGGMYRQGQRTAGVLDDQFVGRGFAVVSNSLNVFAINCDDLLASETMMMTRERAIELLGTPLYTIGWGCSGGAHQVLQIADNYPGLLDGIVPLCNSVDYFRLMQHTSDIRLLYDWFKLADAEDLSANQKQSITGTRLNASPGAWVFQDATQCPEAVSDVKVFHPVSNPNGLRCGQADHQVNSLGRDPETAVARATFDNTGVQYGLNALQSGLISTEQFLDLNEQIGGFDRNGQRSPYRSEADVVGVEAAYRTGRILNAGGGLGDVPIIEIRNYSDLDEDATHLKYGTHVLAARLKREVGDRANHVFLLESHRDGPYSASQPGGDDLSRYALDSMDTWLTALAEDAGPGSRREKVFRNRPKGLVDACYDRNGRRIVEPFTHTGGRCNELYPSYLPPRSMAGGPLTNDVLKCRLKPVDPEDYRVPLSGVDLQRLRMIFPQGICDWSISGFGQVPLNGTWQSFEG